MINFLVKNLNFQQGIDKIEGLSYLNYPNLSYYEYCIEGALNIFVDGKLFYSEEEHFDLITFALFCRKWLNQLEGNANKDFVYLSDGMALTEQQEQEYPKGNICFSHVKDGWKIYSIFQEYDEKRIFSLKDIQIALAEFLDYIDNEVIQNHLKAPPSVTLNSLIEQSSNS